VSDHCKPPKCQTPGCTRDATDRHLFLCAEHAASVHVTLSSGSAEPSKPAEAASAMRERLAQLHPLVTSTGSPAAFYASTVLAFAAEEVRLALAPREQSLLADAEQWLRVEEGHYHKAIADELDRLRASENRLHEFARKVREADDTLTSPQDFVEMIENALAELDSADTTKETP